MSRESIFKTIFSYYKNEYDYILIDCMQSLSMLTINALLSAAYVLIPVQAHHISAKGLEMLISTIRKYGTNIATFENKIFQSVKTAEHTPSGNSIYIFDPKNAKLHKNMTHLQKCAKSWINYLRHV